MGSFQGIDTIDNNSELNFNQFVTFTKDYFSKHLYNYTSEREYFNPNGYWGIYFVNKNIELFLGSERSFFTFQLRVDNKTINVGEIDSRIKMLERTSKKNIIYLINAIKGFLI